MLIDDFMPVYDVIERHHTDVRAKAELVYDTARTLDLSGSIVIRTLFLLRGLPFGLACGARPNSRPGLSLANLLDEGFILLAEQRPVEFVIGVVGKFWMPSGTLRRISPSDFATFDDPDFAKAVWNFSLTNEDSRTIRLSTETRVRCFSDTTRHYFKLYWFCIRRWSGLVRREALQAIARSAEARADAATR